MKFYSTNDKNSREDLKTAVLKGLAEDKGLFMPEMIPVLPASFWDWLPGRSMGEIGFEVLKPYFCPDILQDVFKSMVDDAFDFPVPIKPVEEGIDVLELFHGPTLAFKDVGARFLARVMSYFANTDGDGIHVLVATSGDTGSAVAHGFYDVKGVKVHILYPSGLVSPMQELQFASLGGNINAYEVAGTFDDCQRIVKEAFMDKQLRERLILTSANSINLARFLPQSVYYFHALAQIPRSKWEKLVISVPSGNLGNLTAGLIAWKMGLPVNRFIAAHNINRAFDGYIQSGSYEPHPSFATIANAMDVGDPSNFARIVDLFDGRWESIAELIGAYSYTDNQIGATMRRCLNKNGYQLDPHGATGYAALKDALKSDETGVFLETAHPAKFVEVVEQVNGQNIEIPHRLAQLLRNQKKNVKINNSYNSFKNSLLVGVLA